MENASIFNETVNEFQDPPLRCKGIETIQVNLGYLCNKECSHCHIRAGPDRTEVMGWETMLAIIRHSNRLTPELVDITGGAPEMNPNLGRFIEELRKNGHPVQVRTNLTVLIDSSRIRTLFVVMVSPRYAFSLLYLGLIQSVTCV